jgi:hypothetical protein
MVKYIRNNFLLPELSFSSLEDLNKTFWLVAEKDRQRKHYQKDILISELFEKDKQALFQLPEKEYQCVRHEEVTADKYGYIKVDNRLYSTSPRFAKRIVLAKISFNRVEILTKEHELVVVHDRLNGKKKTQWSGSHT